ncbi:MAG: hypothetical protein QM785_16555 [Pyrinomonadaceae bacterium]
MKNSHVPKFAAGLMTAALLALSAYSQNQTKEEKEYTNLQQGYRLVPMLAEANAVEEPSMRNLLRFTILQYVYSANIVSVFDTTDGETLKFYEDIATLYKQFPSPRVRGWQIELLNALRSNRPHLAKEVETRFLVDVDTSQADYVELITSKNVREIAERTIDRLRRGAAVEAYPRLEVTVRKADTALADRMRLAAIERDEKLVDRIPFTYQVVSPKTLSAESMDFQKRFLRLIVRFAKEKLAGEKDANSYNLALQLVKPYSERIKELMPDLYIEAKALMAKAQSRKTPEQIRQEDVMGRIEASSNRAAQALIEAEAAEPGKARAGALIVAMRYAVSEKEFGPAAELAPVIRAIKEADVVLLDNTLWNQVVKPAAAAKEYGAAEYAAAQIGSEVIRGAAIGDLARELGLNGKREAAIERIREAMKLFEKNDLDRKEANHPFLLVYPAFVSGIEEGFLASRRAIAMANRLPAQRPDEMFGKEGYPVYAEFVLMPHRRVDRKFVRLDVRLQPRNERVSAPGANLPSLAANGSVQHRTQPPLPVADKDPVKLAFLFTKTGNGCTFVLKNL